ncbi:MAG: ATPase [Candidatus Scalindua rubra]|uniref:ATPase n=1 Tax=Candidatus Scalindua rubra TaxID=1872076 RepID=A0A1E3XDY1_9BACT|nr:MAG: ATPase [Candidatus Scalindua rubra]
MEEVQTDSFEDVQYIREKFERVKKEVEKVIVGQDEMIEAIIIALFSDGHILLEGYPGLGKTITVKTLSRAIDAQFQRVQFTPDLIPSDITGFELCDPETRKSTVQKGPVFTNLLLADEINRAPAKVQSALLECMQEKQVTIGRDTFKLEKLFTVLATQNPIEISGTYLLPEAEIDRFMFKIKITYPSYIEEREITERQVLDEEVELNAILSPEEIILLRHFITEKIPLHKESVILKYSTRIVRATRPDADGNGHINNLIMYGASPRASIYLAKAARVYAFLTGSEIILPEHIHKMAYPVLRHRIILTHEAESQGIEPDDIINNILKKVPILEWER